MDNQSCIFWFSGTGNSLYAAKKLSCDLDNMPLVRITSDPPSGAVGGTGAKVGFVFPSYYGNLPRAVRILVEKLDILPETYIFSVVTKGGVGQGSIGSLDNVLKKKGLRLNYGKCVHMPANYVITYNPANPDNSRNALDKADGLFKTIAADISLKKQSLWKLPVTANNLYYNIDKLDEAFNANGECTGCGLCEKVCPVSNIKLFNGKPNWLHHCEHCVACISWCPAKAINYGEKTQERRRYRNPRINVDELKRII